MIPVNLDSLLNCRTVESARVEFIGSWHAETTGYQVFGTICAFANDFDNLNGGYVVIGVRERDSRAELPPAGLTPAEMDHAQKWIRGNCNRLDPIYQPVLSPQSLDGRDILVVWSPGSDTRPHRAPEGDKGAFRYWIRLGSETVAADRKEGLLRGLLEQTAKVPWDVRPAHGARIEDIHGARVREYLRDVRSGLLDEPNDPVVYESMEITTRVNDHRVPRNIGLLFFSDDPASRFRGARIEVAQFAAGGGGDVLEERVFSGGLADQLRECLKYLNNLASTHLQKRPDDFRTRRFVSYPLPAIRESLVNAVYHRSYDRDQVEPTKVYLYPDRIEITSYPGPVPGIEKAHLQPDASIPAAPARNRRIGEFLKDLQLAEGRRTGLPKVFRAMADNGSPVPQFDFDPSRTYFTVTLPAHPEYTALSALRDAAHLRALGDEADAFRRTEEAWNKNPASTALTMEMIRLYSARGRLTEAEEAFRSFRRADPNEPSPDVLNALVAAFHDAGETPKARELLGEQRRVAGTDAVEAGILARRLRDEPKAHQLFEEAGASVHTDPRALLEFAQCKRVLAQEAHRKRYSGAAPYASETNRRLLREARGLLERVLQLDSPPARRAWAFRELANIGQWLGAPVREVEDAFNEAIRLLPYEDRFQQELQAFRSRRG